MAELRQSLSALVERPVCTPPAIDVVAARGASFARRRRVLRAAVGLALVTVASGAWLGIVRQGSEPGVMLATGGPMSAGYIAEELGGYVAVGRWRLTITRDDQVIELSSTSSDPCGPTGTIRPGDEVRGSITGAGSSLRVGEKFACPGEP